MTTGKKIACTFVAGLVPMLLYAYATGPDVRYTAAPGDDPLACATSGCHTSGSGKGPINAAGGSVTATFSSTTYIPGQPVKITINVSDPANALHGFQMTARLGDNNADLSTKQAGRFSYTSGTGVLVLCDNNIPRSLSGNCPASFPIEFIEHNAPRTGTWTFTWTPPTANQGPVHFYVAGNAVNGDGNNGPQDHVYTASYVLQPAVCIQSLPVISKVQSAAGFGGLNTFTSGSYLEITGSNLAGNTREWQDYDFSGNNAPTSLDGVKVSIGNKPAFLSYIQADGAKPSQVNLQAPADSSAGPVSITVTNCSGTSAPVTLTRAPAAPGMLAPGLDLSPFFNVGGKQYLVATFGPTALYVGNPNPDLPGAFRPAKPNEAIWLYGIGFGDTTPAMTPGAIASGQEEVKAQVAVKFGPTSATVTHAGLYPTFVGLYYFIVTVPPNLADGDYQINVTVDGQPLQQSPFFLTVHK